MLLSIIFGLFFFLLYVHFFWTIISSGGYIMLGKRIKELRKQNHLTQSELGSKLGVIKQTVSSWENGVSSPNNDTLANRCV